MTGRTNILNRLLMVVVAVGLAVGSVALMRLVARQIAGVAVPEPSARVETRVETGANAPRRYDLSLMVPESCRYTILGRSCRRTETHHLMPLETLRQTMQSEAVANGWKQLKSDEIAVARALRRNGGTYYETNDGRFIMRRFWSESTDRSHMVEIELPDIRHLDIDVSETGPEPDAFEIAGSKGAIFRAALPALLEKTLVGDPAFTALDRRETGAVFFVVALCREPADAVGLRARTALSAAGWRRIDDTREIYQYANLTLGFDCQADATAASQTVLSYRISDDEVRINQQRSEL